MPASSSMRIGTMRRSVSIQQRSTTQDTYGAQVATWTTIATPWADIRALTGRERMLAQSTGSAVSHEVSIRYRALLADPKAVAAMRIVVTKDGVTRYFNILDARDEEERRRTLIFDCEEGLNDG